MARADPSAVSLEVGIRSGWATLRQVHGAAVFEVTRPGRAGRGDALVTRTKGLPLAVFTADCGGVVLETAGAVAVVHAGWRGVAAGVVAEAARYLGEVSDGGDGVSGGGVSRAAVGPMIGPCCFEVGDEVAVLFAGWEAATRWGTRSVDLGAAIRAQVPDVSWWSADACTRCGEGWFSYRGTGTDSRMATLGWIP